MRRARVLDWRRRLRERQAAWPTCIERIGYQDIPTLGSGEVLISSPLTVLCGSNGAGKTTLLRAIWAALDPRAASATVPNSGKLTAGSIAVDVRVAGRSATAEVEFGVELRSISSADVAAIHIDGASEALRQQEEFSKFESADDIINGSGSRVLDGAALAEVNYILSREYRSISIYEVDVGRTVPFFEVSYGNDRYDSRTMGSGEIAAFYIWWSLDRIDDGSIVLIEEPEAFLSHASQKALANHIVYKVVSKNIYTLISSHSAGLIVDLPKDSLRFLSRGQGGLRIIADHAPPILLKSLGIDPPLSAIIFVEDVLAEYFLRAILERSDPSLARRIDIQRLNGESEISTALKVTGGIRSRVRFVGLYDGDFRGQVPADVASLAAFLPGSVPVETMFRTMVAADPAAFQDEAQNEHAITILAGLEGANYHDWFEELARELGLDKAHLFRTMFGLWMRAEANVQLATVTYEEILALVEVEGA